MTYVFAIMLAGLVALGLIDCSQRKELAAQVAAQAAGKAVNQVQIRDAKDVKAQESEDLHEFVLAKPVPAIRLCSATVQTAAAPSAGAGATPGAVQPVPAGDLAALPEQHADIGPMLVLLGQRADEVANDLREQQTVP